MGRPAGLIAASGGDQAAVMQGMQNSAYGAAADQAYRQARENQKAEDPAEKLKKLGQMKDSGLITQEEFDAKKAEILAEM